MTKRTLILASLALFLCVGFVTQQTTGIYILNTTPADVLLTLRSGNLKTSPYIEIYRGGTNIFTIDENGAGSGVAFSGSASIASSGGLGTNNQFLNPTNTGWIAFGSAAKTNAAVVNTSGLTVSNILGFVNLSGGSITQSTVSSLNKFVMYSGDGSGTSIQFGTAGAVSAGIGYAQQAGGMLEISTGGSGTVGTPRIQIASQGNVGIGQAGGVAGAERLNVIGSINASTNINAANILRGTNGVASYATIAAESIAATGWTNTFGVGATVYVTATAIAFIVKNRSDATIYTSPTLTATLPVHLQPGWAISAASGLAGTALPD